MFTLETWDVQAGRVDEFMAAWRRHTGRALSEAPGIVGGVRLFRAVDRPNHFYCPTLWEGVEVIDAWRSGDNFRERTAHLNSLSEDSSLSVLEVAAELAPREGG